MNNHDIAGALVIALIEIVMLDPSLRDGLAQLARSGAGALNPAAH